MLHKVAFASALLAAVAFAEDDVSRAGRDLALVIALNAPALTSPQTSLNLALDASQEPKYANRITPVGQRQQFLIGSELRRRYVDEAQLLSHDYIISQLYLQAPFVAKNILSLQAQMMGLYPATQANDLTDWQQQNAVPPIAGTDFSEWQKELGAAALPYGLQTFPIQQSGFEKDFMLSLSSKNCALFDSKMSPEMTNITESLDKAIETQYSDIWDQMHEMQVTGVELCDYLTWAHFNAIPLDGDDSRQAEYTKLATQTCPQQLYDQVAATTRKISESNGNLVSSAFLGNIRDKVNLASIKKQMGQNAIDLPLALTNYQALNSDILLTIAAQSLSEDVGTASLPASSSLIFEVWADGTVHGFLNDEEMTPVGCTADAPCTTDLFIAGLEAAIGQKDPETACKSAGEDVIPFIKA